MQTQPKTTMEAPALIVQKQATNCMQMDEVKRCECSHEWQR